MTGSPISCSIPLPIPKWFDAVHRMPVTTVSVEGQRIAYLDRGEGPPVILIHGFSGSLWQWEYQQDSLAATHRLITLDMIGSGWSDKPEWGYTPSELVEFLRKFLDTLDIPRASLVGNSLGAGVAMGMALTYPDRVDRLVLIGGLPPRIRQRLGSPLLKQLLERRPPSWLASVGNWLFGRRMTETVLKELIHDPEKLTPTVIERAFRNRSRPGAIPPLLAMTDNLDLWENGFALRLQEVIHPTLIMWGTQDRIFPPQVGRDLDAILPHSSIILVEESGHLPQWEHPEIVNRQILEFLQP